MRCDYTGNYNFYKSIMKCSGCGSEIPFSGKVCPKCLRDKSSDQNNTVVATVCVVIGAFGGAWLGDFKGMFVGLVAAFIVFCLIAAALPKSSSTDKAPLVTASVDLSTASDPAFALSNKLRQLDVAKAAGLVSDAEYKTAREKILCQ